MSLLSEKQNIFDSVITINSLSESLRTVNNIDSLFNSFNSDNKSSSKDIVPFLIQLLSTLSSVQEVKDLIKKIIVSNSPKFNTIIKNELLSKSSVALTGNLVIRPQDVTISMNQIDPFGNLKVRGSNNLIHKYNLQIGGNIYKGLSNVLDNNTYSDNFFIYTFDNTTNDILFSSTSKNIDKFTLLSNIINNTNFVDGNIIYTEIINLLFGSLYSMNNESSNKILSKEMLNKYLKKSIDNEGVDDKIFNLSQQEINDLQSEIDKKNNGNSFDFDCSNLSINLSTNDVLNILNSQDPLLSLNDKVSNNNLSKNDFNVKYSVDSKTLKREQFIKNNTATNSKFGNTNGIETKLNNDIIKSLSFIIIKNAITSPQYLIINNLIDCYSKNVSVSTQPTDFKTILNDNKKVLNCIIKKLKEEVTTFIYNYTFKVIKKKIQPILINIVKEKAMSYLRIIESLAGF